MSVSLYDFINYVPGFKGLSVERAADKYQVTITCKGSNDELRTYTGDSDEDINKAANSAIAKTRNLK